MIKKLFFGKKFSHYFQDGVHERRPHPEVFRRIIKTNKLLQQGATDEQVEEQSGISLRNYYQFFNKMSQRYGTVEEFKSEYKDLKKGGKELFDKYKVKKAVGKLNALVLMVDFKDNEKDVTEPDKFNELLFERGKNSLKDYYLENSGGKLEIDGELSDWFTAKHNYSNYVDSDNINRDTLRWEMPNATELVRETLTMAKNSFDDFKKFDNYDQGRLDLLIIIYAGEGSHRTANLEQITPHRNKLEKPIELEDGLIADNYILINEIPSFDLGGFCHEVGHSLGLPDLYMPDFSSRVVGKWCLMGGGDYNNNGITPGHLNAWCKTYLGWYDPISIDDKPKKYEISASNEDKIIYKLEIPLSEGKEYFLVENRQKYGFDEYIPAEGLLIWHVNQRKYHHLFPNLDTDNLFISLEQADGKNELETRIFSQADVKKLKITEEDFKGDSGDVFPGETDNTAFNDQSNPNSRSVSGEKSGITIKDINKTGAVISAVMGIGNIEKEEFYSDDFLEGYKLGYGKGYNFIMK
ncbi:MAG: M6 family metalloprotease domain-containing protein [Methanomicrobiales archaeon]